MAEEHVVVPKERYQRMLDQLAEKKKLEQSEPEDDDIRAEDTAEGGTKEKVPNNPTPSHEKNDHPMPRSRDDVTTPTLDHKDTFDPPGITPQQLKEFVNVKKNLKNKKKQEGLLKRRKKSPNVLKKVNKKHSHSSLQKIKKNWLNIK